MACSVPPSAPRFTNAFTVRGIGTALPRNTVAAESKNTYGRRVHIYLPPPPPGNAVPGDLREAAGRHSPTLVRQEEEEWATGCDPMMKVEDEIPGAPVFDAGVAAYPSPKGRHSSLYEQVNRSARAPIDAQDVMKREERADSSLYRPLSPPMSDLPAPPEAADPYIAVDVGSIRASYPAARADRRKVRAAVLESYEAGRAQCALNPSSDDA